MGSPSKGPAKVRKLMDSPPRRAAKACINEKRRCSAGTESRIAMVRRKWRVPLAATTMRKPKPTRPKAEKIGSTPMLRSSQTRRSAPSTNAIACNQASERFAREGFATASISAFSTNAESSRERSIELLCRLSARTIAADDFGYYPAGNFIGTSFCDQIYRAFIALQVSGQSADGRRYSQTVV